MAVFFERIKNFFLFLGGQFEATFIDDKRYLLFLEGLKITILVSLLAALLGIVIGILIAVVKVLHKRTGKLVFLNKVFELYTTIIRGTPVTLQLLIMYTIVFTSSNNSFLIGILTFGINSGAYVSEIIRAGILAVDEGQTEAGRSLGLSQFQTMRLIVLPQAIKNILPALGNEFIALIKETSVIGYIGATDLTKAAKAVSSRNGNIYFTYISVAIIYLIIVVGLSKLFTMLERRFAQSDRS